VLPIHYVKSCMLSKDPGRHCLANYQRQGRQGSHAGTGQGHRGITL
jgi:hypothetical protein